MRKHHRGSSVRKGLQVPRPVPVHGASSGVAYDRSVISSEFLTCTSHVPLLQSVVQCDPFSVIVRSAEKDWDPSTLLSALSQASAVLVAIIGGFLVSRLVAISSEREGIRRLVEAATGRIQHIESDLDQAHQTRLNRAKSYLYEEAVEKILEDPALDLDSLIQGRLLGGTAVDELKPYALSLRQRVQDAVKAINGKLRKGDTKALELEALVERGLVIADADQDIYEQAFKHRRRSLPSPAGLAMFGPSSYADLSSVLRPGIISDAAHAASLRRQDEEIKAEADLRTQLRAAVAERDRLDEELARVGKPVGVAAAMWMLGLLSLGILVPLIMMAFEPKGLDVVSKILLLGSFVIGLVAILWYVGWFWLKIGKDKTQATPGRSSEAPPR
ncbi:hypothetical protein FB478_101839 [Arthrobacter sp. AG367]|jgi:hypothetical protein|nr:hypothetical protein FBY30_3152 [Arthrobacter sp. SLBN-83]TWD56682.1 hypothetical protein FB478_101839 [Arthrobacter sp. AG367]